MRARSKGENHQDKYTKLTGLKFVFTEMLQGQLIEVAFAFVSISSPTGERTLHAKCS